MALAHAPVQKPFTDSGTVEHLVRPPDGEVSALRFALDQIGVTLSTTAQPPRKSLPDVATELLSVTRNPKADAAAVERVVCRDPFVSAQVLSIANSAMYAPRTPVLSVRDAAVRLGMDTVRDLAMMVVTTSSMFRIAGLERQTAVLCHRAVVTAVAARKMAQVLGANTDYAFLSALLHDVGHLLMLEEAAATGILNKRVLSSSELLQVVLERCGHYHQEIGANACRAWKLPEATAQAAYYHHRYLHDGKHYLAANLVAAADLVADALAVGSPAVPLDPDAPVFQTMAMKRAAVQPILDETRAVAASLGVPV